MRILNEKFTNKGSKTKKFKNVKKQIWKFLKKNKNKKSRVAETIQEVDQLLFN